MTEENDQFEKSPVEQVFEENNQEKTQLKLAREAGNVWTHEGREMEMYVADGRAFVAVDLLDRASRQPNGATLVHNFAWDKNDPFIIREQSLKTKLKSVGRQTKQEIDSANINSANTKLYESIVAGGEILSPGENGKIVARELSREQMLSMAETFPELASEAIEAWLEGWHFEIIDSAVASFDWMFQASPVVQVFGWTGLRTIPDAAVIITFATPTAAKREKYEDERQKINSDRIGELKIVDVQESFVKKIQYGAEYLKSAEGVAVGEPGVIYTDQLKQKFITLFGPLQFAEAVDKMHESFDFTKGKAASS